MRLIQLSLYAVYNEKFTNFKTNNIRENEINLYMPTTIRILNLAKSKITNY